MSRSDFSLNNENLPSVDNYILSSDDLPSVEESIDNTLPSVNDFLVEDFEEEQSVDDNLPSIQDFLVEEEIEEQLEDICEEVITGEYISTEDLILMIEDVRKNIQEIPEVRYYEEPLLELNEKINLLPEVKYYDDEIEILRENLEDIKNSIPKIPEWVNEDFYSSLLESVSSFENDINFILDKLDIIKFENKVDNKTLEEKIKEYDHFKNDVHGSIEILSEDLISLSKSLRNSEEKILQSIPEFPEIPEVKYYDKDIELLKDSISSLNEKILEIKIPEIPDFPELPKVKYYDEDIKNLYDIIKDLSARIKLTEEKLEESQKIEEEVKEDPLKNTNFATLDDLKKHYTLFINRIQKQLETVGGGGETRLEFLDDVDSNSAKTDGYLLSYQASTGKWIGVAGGGDGGGGSGISTYSDFSGIATYSTTSGISTYSSVSGIATYSSTAGIATYSFSSGITTYASTSGIATVSQGITGTPSISVSSLTSTEGSFSGIVTASNSVVIKAGTATTALIVEGDARVTGILTIGTSSITLDGDINQVNVGTGVTLHHTKGIQVGGNTLHSSGLTLNHFNVSGISTISQLDITDAINVSGPITATEFIGIFSGNSSSSTYANNSGISSNSNRLDNQLPSYYLDYNNFTNTPVNLSEFSNDVGFITSSSLVGYATETYVDVAISNLVSSAPETLDTLKELADALGDDPNFSVTITNILSNKLSLTGGVVSGIITSSGFIGDLTGTATYAINSGISTYAVTAGIATYSETSGISTYSEISGISTYSNTSGIATYSEVSGISTYAEESGISTYSNTSGIATYATSSGIATYSTTSGVSTYSSISGIATVSEGLTGTPNINVGSIIATDAIFNGNVNIAGTITYEDVTNVDSIGIITARNSAVIKTGTATTALIVEGDTRITGILTIGTSSITLDGDINQVNVGSGITIHHTNGVQVGGNTLHTSGLTLNHVIISGISTISQLEISTDLNVSGVVTSTSYVLPDGLISSGVTTTTTISETVIDSFSSTEYRSAKYQIQVTTGSQYQITEIFIIHDGTTSYQTEYATVKTGITLSTFSSDINLGNLRLLATPTSIDSTTFKIIRTTIDS